MTTFWDAPEPPVPPPFARRRRRSWRSRIVAALATILFVVVATAPLILVHTWVAMVVLGTLAAEFDLPQLAISFWQAFLLRLLAESLVHSPAKAR